MPLRTFALLVGASVAGAALLWACGAPRPVVGPAVAAPHPDAAIDAHESETPLRVAVGYGHTCVALRDGRAKCWGPNDHGELGRGPATSQLGLGPAPDGGASVPAMCLGAGERAVAFGFSFSTVCALLASGHLKCFGEQPLPGPALYRDVTCGMEGDSVPPVDLGTRQRVVAFASAPGHQCALLDGGRVKCWGLNDDGELGLGDREPRFDVPDQMGDHLPFVDLGKGRRARAIGVGAGFSCALLQDDHVKCWGEGVSLGLGIKDDRGAAPGQMGDALPTVDLGTNRTAVALASGAGVTCVILDTHEVKCWGKARGALPQCDDYAAGDEPAETGDGLPTVSLGTSRRVRDIAVGSESACAILDDRSLKCWSEYRDKAFGEQHTHGCHGGMGDALPVVDFGPGRTARQVSLDGVWPCAVLDDDEVRCWTLFDTANVAPVMLGN